jgi:peptide deformylase
MSIEKVLDYKEMISKKSDVVNNILSEETQTLIDTLIESSMSVGGYGLGAPQIGVNKQVFVYRKNVDGNKDSYKVIINPEIIVSSGKLKSKGEGCLSIEGVRKTIIRSKTFILKCYNKEGKEIRAKGNTKKETIILQHEYDHMMGKFIIDY